MENASTSGRADAAQIATVGNRRGLRRLNWVDLTCSPSPRRTAGLCALPSSAASSLHGGNPSSCHQRTHAIGYRSPAARRGELSGICPVHIIPSDVQHIYIVVQFKTVRSLDTPRPSDASWWGGLAVCQQYLPGPQLQASEGNMLRQRCDARGFTPLPIENIARRKVAPAFEATGRRAGSPKDEKRSRHQAGMGPSLHVQCSVWRSTFVQVRHSERSAPSRNGRVRP